VHQRHIPTSLTDARFFRTSQREGHHAKRGSAGPAPDGLCESNSTKIDAASSAFKGFPLSRARLVAFPPRIAPGPPTSTSAQFGCPCHDTSTVRVVLALVDAAAACVWTRFLTTD
jgi:hypothetical protein